MTNNAPPPFATERKETTIPLLPCVSPEDTLAFYQALGFQVTYEMTRPYLYLALRFRGFELHFGKAPKGLDPKEESSGGCLVLVDAVEPYHRAFTEAMRAKYGKVLASGKPRMTRFRPGQSRFSLIDPSGNNILFIRRDEPEEVEYGGSKALAGLAKALDNARILRDFKNDDRAAARVLDKALAKYGAEAPVVDRVQAMAARMELAIAMDDAAMGQALREQLQALPLSDEERDRLSEELKAAERLEQWLARAAATRQA
ncbi:glyoxalase [Polyangium mundeleinium]|uniref:Glyoxalase n=1 Tax=Polyangium mundeleinium TaxID=2995306 RepID=A0ABT5EQI7_9BACT|nr:glyoxalase [Polyangium mundeleinium]MDC0744094.1 glyoxalase [Polyangium mundeleinium]